MDANTTSNNTHTHSFTHSLSITSCARVQTCVESAVQHKKIQIQLDCVYTRMYLYIIYIRLCFFIGIFPGSQLTMSQTYIYIYIHVFVYI